MSAELERTRMETLLIALRNQATLASELASMWQMQQDIDFPVTTYMQSTPSIPAEIPLIENKSSDQSYEELLINLTKQTGSEDNALTESQITRFNATYDESIKKKGNATGSVTKSDFVYLLGGPQKSK